MDVHEHNQKKERPSSKKLKALLIESFSKIPIVQVTLEKYSVPRSTYYKWRSTDPKFLRDADEAITNGSSVVNDIAESELIKLIKKGNFKAITYWLENNSHKYNKSLPAPKEEFFDPKELEELGRAMKNMGLGAVLRRHNRLAKKFLESKEKDE